LTARPHGIRFSLVKIQIPLADQAPANRPRALEVKNLDGVAMEFESVSLRVEK
jgi:hypothetical protein